VLNETKGKSISDETAARVREAAAELHYTPNRIAQSMRMGRSRMIAFVTFWGMSEYVTQQIMAGAFDYIRDAGYQMVLISPKSEESAAYTDPYRRNQIDGLLLLENFRDHGHVFDETPHLDAINQYRIPAVFINGQENGRIRNFPIRLEATTYLSARYFAEKGYKSIDYVQPNDAEAGLPRTLERQHGFERAMSEFGFTGRQYTTSGLRRRLEEKSAGESLALVVSKSNYVGEVLGIIRETGLQVPGDVAVVTGSYEPSYLANLVPAVSYVRVPTYEIGMESCRCLLSLVEGRPYEPRSIPEPEVHTQHSG